MGAVWHMRRQAGKAVVRGLWLAAFAALVGHALHSVGALGEGYHTLFTQWVYDGLLGFSAIVCLARGLTVRERRSGWLVLGLALVFWTAGELTWSLLYAGLESAP